MYSLSHQRVLNYLYRVRLSRPPPPTVRKHDRQHTGTLRKRDNLLTGKEGEGVARSRIIRPQGSLVLYK
jgi:hypothetical protein